jgi:predicted flavoprotein YhiN
VPWLVEKGVQIRPWQPANMGFSVDWTPHMQRHFGAAIKGALLMAGDHRDRGEFVISERGVEGGGVYSISRALRDGAKLTLNLMPDVDDIAQRLARMKPSETLVNRLRKLGLSPAAIALIMEFGRDMDTLTAIESLPIKVSGPRPLDEAISVAGGISAAALGPNLELRALPRVFACGEMLDWEAPTGGYLLTACWATGAAAGKAAAKV